MMFSHISIAAVYIDPGTTSYLIQILVGAAVALGAVIGIFWNKLRRLFRKNKTESEAKPEVNIAERQKKDISAADLLDEDENGNTK